MIHIVNGCRERTLVVEVALAAVFGPPAFALVSQSRD
jgi:hypothetical protein